MVPDSVTLPNTIVSFGGRVVSGFAPLVTGGLARQDPADAKRFGELADTVLLSDCSPSVQVIAG